MPKRIPVSAAKKFAADIECTQVIVMAWDGERSHVVTWGATVLDCDQAAQGGDLMKATMGWPYDPTCLPSRVKKLQTEVDRLRLVQRGAVEAAYREGFVDAAKFGNRVDDAWMLSALNGAEYDPTVGWRPDATMIKNLRNCVTGADLPQDECINSSHLRSMLDRMESHKSENKFNRWVGYIQGVLVATGNGTVDQFKDMNR